MPRTEAGKSKREAWSGDHDMSPSCVRELKTVTGQHWHCSGCKAENTGSHDWWRDRFNDTDDQQRWLCVSCQRAVYGWIDFPDGREPLMRQLLQEWATQTKQGEQGEPGGTTSSTQTLLEAILLTFT